MNWQTRSSIIKRMNTQIRGDFWKTSGVFIPSWEKTRPPSRRLLAWPRPFLPAGPLCGREEMSVPGKQRQQDLFFTVIREQEVSCLSILMASVLRSFSSQVSLSSAMIFSVSWRQKQFNKTKQFCQKDETSTRQRHHRQNQWEILEILEIQRCLLLPFLSFYLCSYLLCSYCLFFKCYIHICDFYIVF